MGTRAEDRRQEWYLGSGGADDVIIFRADQRVATPHCIRVTHYEFLVYVLECIFATSQLLGHGTQLGMISRSARNLVVPELMSNEGVSYRTLKGLQGPSGTTSFIPSRTILHSCDRFPGARLP
ncbi:hypothetical protein BDV96DRAFT_586897 [Lophiotrema nucula]|uniref:Uncharacterized protein n=1 Tax=Lophiotrema nucula TaxID=690887 RepID=A0A6A5YR81_9PLEO|nr:hypothetical protein BDV96DRAFT_586897 [Lophiotrema nucula]